MSLSLLTRLAGMFSDGGDVKLARRAFLGAATAGAALAVVPGLISSPARADDSDQDHIGDALQDLRKARKELVQVDHDHKARDYALQQIDQAINATQNIQNKYKKY